MKLKVKEIALFAVLSAILFVSKLLMEALPNVHLMATLIVAYTVVFRKKAIIPIYVYVFLNGLIAGFAAWWIPYLYMWTVLFFMVLLIPKIENKKLASIIYMSVAALHGLIFGLLYAPSQAIMFGLDFKATVAWVIAGLPFDLIHAVSNFICGILIMPCVLALKRVKKLL